MSIRTVGRLVSAVAAALICGCSQETEAPIDATSAPHVVVIVLDTLRADSLGCYGGPDGVSPELDAWAEQGVRFASVTAPSNWTKPSWAGLLTGRHPRALGVYRELGECLPDDAVTLSEAFRDQGYATYGATANPNINSVFNYHQGFEVYRDTSVVWDWMQVSTGNGKGTSKESKLPAANDLYRDALTWAADQDGPCYIQICTMEMHEYHRGALSLNRPEFQNDFATFPSPEREYYQALKQSSRDAHAFVEALRKLPGWNDVLVVVTSDHGEGLSDHPDIARANFHGGVMYDSNLHVPFIAYRPGSIPSNVTIDDDVSLLDVAPTIVDWAGAPALAQSDGQSLMPFLKPTSADGPEPTPIVSESYLRDMNKLALSLGEWRYIENRDQANEHHDQHGQLNAEELQRVGAPQNGRATDQREAHPEIMAQLRDRLRQWEQANPKAPASECGAHPTDDILEQLRSIGYIDGEDDSQDGS